MKKLEVVVLGLGNRGGKYVNYMSQRDDVNVVAICDKNPDLLIPIGDKLKVEKRFKTADELFAAGKLGDAMVIATQDRDHYEHAKKALQLGYHLLLEKPISPILEQTQELERIAREKELKVVVCHVLRYSDFYGQIKHVLDKGAIGKVVSINQTENIGYWHYSHSYVRGNWRKEENSSPAILAKCCHDLDIIYYFTGAKCKSLYSYATRQKFLKSNDPEGSPERCLDGCKYEKVCPYHVKKLYYGVTKSTIPVLLYHWKTVAKNAKPNRKMVIEALRTTSPYGRCVYKCDNDVVESQVIAMKLENNTSATFTMNAFAKNCYRHVHIMGTEGEIIGNDKDGWFRLNVFGQRSKKVKVKSGGIAGHLGGDRGIVNEFCDYMLYGKETMQMTMISETLESHQNALMAEVSRKENRVIHFD